MSVLVIKQVSLPGNISLLFCLSSVFERIHVPFNWNLIRKLTKKYGMNKVKLGYENTESFQINFKSIYKVKAGALCKYSNKISGFLKVPKI